MSYETQHKWDGIAAVESKLKEEEAWCKQFREAVWLADRLADYVRMHFGANPPMPETIAVPWRDYLQARGRSPNEKLCHEAGQKGSNEH